MVGDANFILMDTGEGAYLQGPYGSHCERSYGEELDNLHMQLLEQTKHFRLYKLPEKR